MVRTREWRRSWQAAVAWIVVISSPPQGRAAPPPGAIASGPATSERVAGEDEALYRCNKAHGQATVNLRPGIKLAELAGWAMSFSCKNLVFRGAIGERGLDVTVMAPQPMVAAAAWRLFLVALASMNLTVVPRGDFLEIVEAPTAKRHALPLFRSPARAPTGEELVRVVFRPSQVTSANLSQALTALASASGEVVELGWAGVVVVTDHGSHIQAMREMMEEIDRPGSDQGLYFLPLHRAAASELVETLRAILAPDSSRGAPAPPPARSASKGSATEKAAPPDDPAPARILADERTNALILLSSRAAYERTRALVERLDVEGSGSGGRVHIHHLEHGSAEKIAETLAALVGQRSAPGSGGGRPGAPARAPGGERGPGDSLDLVGDVRVTADPTSNALLVLSSDRDNLALQKIVRELDAPRAQVFIEALVIEVGSGQSRQIGTAWHAGRMTRDGLWLGALGHPQFSSLVDLGEAAKAAGQGTGLGVSGFLGGIIGVPIPGAEALLGTSIPSFTVLFQALARSNHVEILSAPHVMTTDHVEANLAAGKSVPIVTGFTGLPGTAPGSFSQVDRKPIGLTLKVTPHVGATGKVRLDIDLVLEEILPDAGVLGPSTSKRQIKNSVVVGDQESAVLGGLMTQKRITAETKIPVLGDFPILGLLFRQRETLVEKANLVVLITPYVVLDSVDSARAVERVLERRGEFLGALERLDRMGYRPRRRADRMRGLVSEIERKLAHIEEERAVLRRLDLDRPGQAGPIEPSDTDGTE